MPIDKSGDADRVTLTATGIKVVHYDIFSGPNVVGGESRGREKICDVLRIKYDPTTNSVFFGGNHGFVWGDANYAGNPTCNGQPACSGVWEHTHPAINGSNADGSCCVLLTGGYYGVAIDPSGDAWFGGYNRTTRYMYATNGVRAYDPYQAEVKTENVAYAYNRIDVWPDLVPNEARPNQRKDDVVSSIAVIGNSL